jgi:hypothetical protein
MLIIDDNFLTKNEILKYHYFDHEWHICRLADPDEKEYYSFPEFELESNPEFDVDSKLQFVNTVKLFDFENKHLYDELALLVNKFAKKNNIEVLEISRMKFNLMVNSKNIKNEINPPHVDQTNKFFKPSQDDPDVKLFVLLCYINDSDGPTIIYNEKYPVTNFKELSIKDKIYPKAGRAIFFEGDQYHSSSFPIDSTMRMVLNINLVGKINQQ